jgi:hypothetical protein
VAVTLAPEQAVAQDDVDAAVKDARGEPRGWWAGQIQGQAPGHVEAVSLGTIPKSIGAERSHAGGERSAGDATAIGERLEEAAYARRCPATATHGAAVGGDVIVGDRDGDRLGEAIRERLSRSLVHAADPSMCWKFMQAASAGTSTADTLLARSLDRAIERRSGSRCNALG